MAERPPDDKAPLCALAFKVAMVEGRKTVFLRIYSGVLRRATTSTTRAPEKNEKVARLFSVHADRRERIERAGAGRIVVAMGLKDTARATPSVSPKAPILLERIDTYEPVISRAIEPQDQADKEKLERRWARWPTRIRPSAWARTRRPGRRSSAAWASCTWTSCATGCDASTASTPVGRPAGRVPRDLAGPGDGRGALRARRSRTRRCSGMRGARGAARARRRQYPALELPPPPAVSGAARVPEMPQAIIDAAMEGASEACGPGPQGYPFEDIEVVITGIESGPRRRRRRRKAAVGEALRNAFRDAGTRLLEPIMHVEVMVPEAILGDVLGDL